MSLTCFPEFLGDLMRLGLAEREVDLLGERLRVGLRTGLRTGLLVRDSEPRFMSACSTSTSPFQ